MEFLNREKADGDHLGQRERTPVAGAVGSDSFNHQPTPSIQGDGVAIMLLVPIEPEADGREAGQHA
jgi:hypothetical protein